MADHGTVTTTVGGEAASRAFAGDTVTVNYEPAAGYALSNITVMQGETQIASSATAPFDFTMREGDVTVTATTVFTAKPTLESQNLTLDGTIGLNLKLTLPDGAPPAEKLRVELYVNDELKSAALLSSYTPTSGVYEIMYRFPARKMDDKLKLMVYNTETETYMLKGAGGTDYSETGFTTSVADCCDIYATAGGPLQALAIALKTYGVYAHSYLDGASLPDPAPALTATVESFASCSVTKNLPDGLKLKSVYLTLATDTAINFRFKLTGEDEIDAFTFKLGDTVLTAAYSEDGGGTYVVTVPNIAAKNLGTEYTVNITKKDDSGVYSVACSTLYYGKLAMNTSKNALKNACRALFDYKTAAVAYFG